MTDRASRSPTRTHAREIPRAGCARNVKVGGGGLVTLDIFPIPDRPTGVSLPRERLLLNPFQKPAGPCAWAATGLFPATGGGRYAAIEGDFARQPRPTA
jgi:hypothetical protein